jgi:hypothetical protein
MPIRTDIHQIRLIIRVIIGEELRPDWDITIDHKKSGGEAKAESIGGEDGAQVGRLGSREHMELRVVYINLLVVSITEPLGVDVIAVPHLVIEIHGIEIVFVDQVSELRRGNLERMEINYLISELEASFCLEELIHHRSLGCIIWADLEDIRGRPESPNLLDDHAFPHSWRRDEKDIVACI